MNDQYQGLWDHAEERATQSLPIPDHLTDCVSTTLFCDHAPRTESKCLHCPASSQFEHDAAKGRYPTNRRNKSLAPYSALSRAALLIVIPQQVDSLLQISPCLRRTERKRIEKGRSKFAHVGVAFRCQF